MRDFYLFVLQELKCSVGIAKKVWPLNITSSLNGLKYIV
jgi:hypothetical protein